jgi:hypothetical protein
MIRATEVEHSVESVGNSATKSGRPAPASAPAGGSTVDEMSEWSFPASDPPAVWTWEPSPPTPSQEPARG